MLDKKAFCTIKDGGQTHGLVAFTQSTTFLWIEDVCRAVYFWKASSYIKFINIQGSAKKKSPPQKWLTWFIMTMNTENVNVLMNVKSCVFVLT